MQRYFCILRASPACSGARRIVPHATGSSASLAGFLDYPKIKPELGVNFREIPNKVNSMEFILTEFCRSAGWEFSCIPAVL